VNRTVMNHVSLLKTGFFLWKKERKIMPSSPIGRQSWHGDSYPPPPQNFGLKPALHWRHCQRNLREARCLRLPSLHLRHIPANPHWWRTRSRKARHCHASR